MADVAPPAPSFKKRTNKSNLRKRPATPPPADDSDSDPSTDDEQGGRVKRRKKDGVNLATASRSKNEESQDFSKSTKYAADRSTNITANEDATKASTWYTDASLASADSAVAAAKAQRQQREDNNDDTPGGYKGAAQYSNFIQKHPDAKPAVGPVKAPTNVRQITVTDFAPDVCKDYKQTGFCGFGDSCKFLHAREDYKQGWQLDKEWEKVGKNGGKVEGNKSKMGASKEAAPDDGLTEEERLLENIPFKCIICKDDYKTPVVTKCGHYFCEKCAMGRYMKEKKRTCANCGQDTSGSFGVARKLKELLKKKEQREAEKEDGGSG